MPWTRRSRPGVVVDGEVVTSGVEAVLYLFDVTVVAGHDVTALTLRTRKRLLDQVTELSGPVRLCPHRPGHEGDLACRAGLVLKRANAPYRAGWRSADWLVLPGDR